MKKVSFFLLAASLLLAAACNKEGGQEEIVFPDPATKDVAVNIQFNKGEKLKVTLPDRSNPNDPNSVKTGVMVETDVLSIDLTEGNRYVLYIGDVETKAAGSQYAAVWTGHYTYAGGRYKMDGFGELSIENDSECLFQPVSVRAGEWTGTRLPVTVTPIKANGTIALNLARNWKVNSTYIKIEGGKNSISVSRNYDGCDLSKIAGDLKAKGAPLSDEDVAELSKYNLKEITFIGNNKLVMNLQGPKSFYGNWYVSGTSFNWELNDGNEIIANKVSGTVSFPGKGMALLVVSAGLTAEGENYTGTVEFSLSPVS